MHFLTVPCAIVMSKNVAIVVIDIPKSQEGSWSAKFATNH